MKYVALIYAMVIFFATPVVAIRLIRHRKDTKLYLMAIISLITAMLVHPFCIVIALTGNGVGITLSILTLVEAIISMCILFYFYQFSWRTLWK